VKERLQKVLARAGVASRRAAERLIVEGRVAVNGKTVQELGQRVDAECDAIRVDGRPIPRRPAAPTYLMVNKPRGVLTTLADPQGRPTIRDLVPGLRRRVFPIGRLDYQSEGLLLLTDDGELARDLMHPGSGVAKTYAVKVRGQPAQEVLERLGRGIPLDGRRTRPARVRVLRPGNNAWLEVTVIEGRKHLVRRMLQIVGHPVSKLRRVGYDGLRLGRLPVGEVRRLTSGEVERLRRAASAGSRRQPRQPA
jgi:pseudouridine synthase